MRGSKLRALLLAGALFAAFLFSGCIAELDDDDDDDKECEDWAYWNNNGSTEGCPYADDDDDFLLGAPALFQATSSVAILGIVAVGLNNRSNDE